MTYQIIDSNAMTVGSGLIEFKSKREALKFIKKHLDNDLVKYSVIEIIVEFIKRAA